MAIGYVVAFASFVKIPLGIGNVWAVTIHMSAYLIASVQISRKKKARKNQMNKCYFTGFTTRDIELKYTQNNTAYGKFSLAVTTGHGENRKTHFFNMTAWGKTAETMSKYVTKGTKIMVECEANQNSYTDKNGNKVNTVDFRVDSFEFCESKGAQQENSQDDPKQQSISDMDFMQLPDIDDSELPFK